MRLPVTLTLLYLLIVPAVAQERESSILFENSYNLLDSGRTFLLNEARRVELFMLGELHGEREIPELLNSVWPAFHQSGYRYVAAEVSPWAARKLEFSNKRDSLKVEGLWTNHEARRLHLPTDRKSDKILWGCDMEEIALGDLIKEFVAERNITSNSGEVQKCISDGYNRKLAPKLLTIVNSSDWRNKFQKDELYQSILISLRIDSARAFPESRFKAQLLREELLKISFLQNFNAHQRSKVLLRFGRNHLHYGFDERGISTLGNFISEFSLSKKLKCFNVATFAAGGECRLMGKTFDADERSEDLAFQFLSQQAKCDAALFDLRPLRTYLHTIAPGKRSDLQRRLAYWADSYDAIICFKTVTPR